MNGLEDKQKTAGGHASQNEIDSLLAELGYQAPRTKPAAQAATVAEPPVEARPRRAARAEEPPAEARPRSAVRAQEPPAEERPRRAARAEEPPAEERPKKRRGLQRVRGERRATQQPTVDEPRFSAASGSPADEAEEAPLLDIPIGIPRRAPLAPVPESRFLRKLRESLDENVDEIEVLTALPSADGTVRLTRAQHTRKVFYLLVGLVFTVAACWGLISLGSMAVRGVRNFASGNDRRQVFETVLAPLVVMDIPMFENAEALGSDQVLSAAIWETIMHSDLSGYQQTMGVAVIPAADIEHAATQLFGGGLTFQHRTIGTGDLQFYYNEDLKSYHIPVAPAFFSYSPQVVNLQKDGAQYTVEVAYQPETPAWQQQEQTLETEKRVCFVLEEQDGIYLVRSATNITQSET